MARACYLWLGLGMRLTSCLDAITKINRPTLSSRRWSSQDAFIDPSYRSRAAVWVRRGLRDQMHTSLLWVSVYLVWHNVSALTLLSVVVAVAVNNLLPDLTHLPPKTSTPITWQLSVALFCC